MIKKLYPLKFEPILKQVVWGGDRLVKDYSKTVPVDEEGNPLADASHIGETWEISDMGEDRTSFVSNGFLAENDLADILETYLGDLVGDNVFDFFNLQFPLLIKLLDIEDRLSVQVHPDDETAMNRYASYGKTEFWYVMDASEDAVVYMGFKENTSAQEFYDACRNGSVVNLMNEFHPKKGDSFFIKAGTVHAASGGLVIAEVQESSDVTFRLYDWGRENNPDTRREMHLEEAIDCIDYNKYDEDANYMKAAAGSRILADCRQFTISCIDLDKPLKVDDDAVESFTVYICTSGAASVKVSGQDDEYDLVAGEVVLMPASLDDYLLVPKEAGTRLLETHVAHMDDVDGYFDEEEK